MAEEERHVRDDRHGGDSGLLLDPSGVVKWTVLDQTLSYDFNTEEGREAYIARVLEGEYFTRKEAEADVAEMRRIMAFTEEDSADW